MVEDVRGEGKGAGKGNREVETFPLPKPILSFYHETWKDGDGERGKIEEGAGKGKDGGYEAERERDRV